MIEILNVEIIIHIFFFIYSLKNCSYGVRQQSLIHYFILLFFIHEIELNFKTINEGTEIFYFGSIGEKKITCRNSR